MKLTKIAAGEYECPDIGLYVRKVRAGAGMSTHGGHSALHTEWEASRNDALAVFDSLADVRAFLDGLSPTKTPSED